ncbi:PIN domain-containing protein [Lutimonas halocynthiae]|uniref:type II toxin-antitoxin system VapC family toxin n=1 Tax=Lutimonas halocynthiae TaxID=1446477 RepID=UPI0025B42FCF|nr:PIN domain-containing protein [Lutimonas halocynthiae]MDN3641794.1 PIN domain-containing protein [Lutimonas halocynthiae]
MDALLVDTNIVLDLLAERKEFLIEAQELFTLSDKKEVKLYVSSLTFANTFYILSQNLKLSDARKILRKFKVLVEVLPMDDKIIDLSLESDFKDFEDAIQYHTAIENDIKIIITRNLKDFKTSKIPVLTAKSYMGLIQQP